MAAFGALAALYAREYTGQGQVVETSLASVSVMLQSGEFVSYRGRRRHQSVGAISPARGPDTVSTDAGMDG